MDESDSWDLISAAVRDFVPEPFRVRAYDALKQAGGNPETGVRVDHDNGGLDDLAVDPEVKRILTYMMKRAEHDEDVVTALRIIGKWVGHTRSQN